MAFRYLIMTLLFCIFAVHALSAQNTTAYDADGIKFNHPLDAVTEQQSSKGLFSAASCSAADGSYISICVFRDKTTVDEAIKIYRERLEKDCAAMKASEIKVTDIAESVLSTPAKGFLLSFRLKKAGFENRTLCMTYQDKVICIVRQYVTDKKAAAEPFFQQVLSSLKLQ